MSDEVVSKDFVDNGKIPLREQLVIESTDYVRVLLNVVCHRTHLLGPSNTLFTTSGEW